MSLRQGGTRAGTYPPLEGKGRSRAARAGWGDLSTRAPLDVERLSPHPVSHFAVLNVSRPTSELRSSRTLQGRVERAYSAASDFSRSGRPRRSHTCRRASAS
ncbi:hypothetical protein EAV90_11745 [Bradyrhizobium vignae]|nr:hypothetical protein EAV90_11745 [Bradyrhizobium vignae]